MSLRCRLGFHKLILMRAEARTDGSYGLEYVCDGCPRGQTEFVAAGQLNAILGDVVTSDRLSPAFELRTVPRGGD